jgi:hypothetical protein
MRQAAVVDVEIRIEHRLALSAEKGGLGLDPQARLHLLCVGGEARVQVAHDHGKLICDIVLLTRILCKIEQFSFSRKQRNLDQLPVAFADGAAEGFDIDQDPASGEWLRSFAVITTDANELVAQIHNRMPLILAPGDYSRWLSNEPDPRDLLRPFPAEPMRMWPISTRVNKPENDDPSIVEPITRTASVA